MLCWCYCEADGICETELPVLFILFWSCACVRVCVPLCVCVCICVCESE